MLRYGHLELSNMAAGRHLGFDPIVSSVIVKSQYYSLYKYYYCYCYCYCCYYYYYYYYYYTVSQKQTHQL